MLMIEAGPTTSSHVFTFDNRTQQKKADLDSGPFVPGVLRVLNVAPKNGDW